MVNSQARELPMARGRQADVVFMRPSGSMVVLGTAGSGKSLMAIHRAARLADPATENHGPTLLITYNKALVAYLRRWADSTLDRVSILNYSKWARDTAAAGGRLAGWTPFAQYGDRDDLVRAGVEDATRKFPKAAVLERPTKFFVEEFDWIAGMGCVDEAAYQAATRVGRGGGVNRGEPRSAVWAAYSNYRTRLAASRFTEDWSGLTSLTLDALRSGDAPSAYRHVVVDEAQDLSPQSLRALSQLVPADGSLTLFADYAQQLYGNRLSWTQVGIPQPTIERFAENYRNSEAIARLAIAMAEQGYFRDTDDLVTPTASVSPGDKPVIVHCQSVNETDYVVQLAQRYAATQRVGILVKSHEEIRKFQEGLGGTALVFHGESTSWEDQPGVTLTTFHSAKGVEFGTVILPSLSASRFPDPELIEAFGEREAIERDARLLYVGLTRARSNLILTHTDELTTLLPPDQADLTERVTR